MTRACVVAGRLRHEGKLLRAIFAIGDLVQGPSKLSRGFAKGIGQARQQFLTRGHGGNRRDGVGVLGLACVKSASDFGLGASLGKEGGGLSGGFAKAINMRERSIEQGNGGSFGRSSPSPAGEGIFDKRHRAAFLACKVAQGKHVGGVEPARVNQGERGAKDGAVANFGDGVTFFINGHGHINLLVSAVCPQGCCPGDASQAGWLGGNRHLCRRDFSHQGLVAAGGL